MRILFTTLSFLDKSLDKVLTPAKLSEEWGEERPTKITVVRGEVKKLPIHHVNNYGRLQR